MNTTETLRFDSAELEFFDERVLVDSRESAELCFFFSQRSSDCWYLDWQVAQILNALVEHLTH